MTARQPTAAQVLAAIRSGIASPDDVRAASGLPATDTREALAAGRWVRAGAMEVRLT